MHPPPAAPSADTDDSVLAEQARAVQANLTPLLAGNAVMTVIVGWAVWGSVSTAGLLIWMALQGAQTAYGALAAVRARRRPITARNAMRRLRQSTVGMVANSLLWAIGLVAFWPAEPEKILLLVLIATGLTVSVMHAALAWLPLVHGYFAPIGVAVVASALLAGGRINWVIALIATVHVLTSLRLSLQMHRTVVEAMRGRYALARLTADLQAQRDRAEEASAAKSRFLAAASHDLRQPVHALNLMLGAWRAHPDGPEAERLRTRVESTVASLGSLFNALLDMSRLDAGTVPVQARPVALAPLLARLAAEMDEAARARALDLSFDAGGLVLHTDDVLLERVLRNLLHNALRYTPRGSVRVVARARNGQAVLRIADTGLGIPRGQLEAVFQEFVQLHNPERDRSQGLGLGLAIVRRLCGLLGIGIGLRSRVGRGTVFTLRVPLAVGALPGASCAETAAATPPPGHATAPAGSVPGDLVLVIDDDADIRAGMQVLLASWGHTVITAGALADLQPALLPLSRAPALIICDYRLRDGQNGLRVIQQLRDEFNDDELPALLITGDTAPQRLQEAAASGLQVLHKPVDPAQLRAAIDALRAGWDRPLPLSR
jgi:two-component system, sensor histidine kinase